MPLPLPQPSPKVKNEVLDKLRMFAKEYRPQ